jgi:hypothetical protein
LVAIYYATKWVEAKALKTNITIVIARFLYEYILTKFGCPLTIIIKSRSTFHQWYNETFDTTISVKAC